MTLRTCKKCGKRYYGNTTSKYCSIKCGRNKTYYNNREKINERTMKWRKENPEKHKETSHRYYLKNREAYINGSAEWQKKHPRKTRKSNRKAVKKFTTEKKEQFNKLIMNGYYKDKKKWAERGYVGTHREKFLELLPKKCACCGKKPIKIISHITYNVKKRKKHPTQEEIKKYLIEYAKLLLPFCIRECRDKYLKKLRK